jgi:hypothetical protein
MVPEHVRDVQGHHDRNEHYEAHHPERHPHDVGSFNKKFPAHLGSGAEHFLGKEFGSTLILLVFSL